MKKILVNFLCAAACLVMACACDPNEHDNLAQINSFAFTSALNSALGSDCVGTIEGTTIKVVVPAGVNLTSLIPTFEVTVNDMVTIGSTAAESGVTACDFSANPKITVNDIVDGTTAEYTIVFAENDGKAELVSFGFFAADNNDLEEDAVASEIAEEMIIRVPDGGAGRTLKAKFEAGFGDVVKIDGNEVSGVTEVDCSFPIDIVVTDPVAGVSKTYVVKVGKILKMQWTKVLEYKESEGSLWGDLSLAINPVSNVPYFAYNIGGIDGKKRAVAVAKYEDGAMTYVGTPNFNAVGTTDSGYAKLAFDNDGVAYVFYSDGDNSKLATVRKLEGDWNVVGSAGLFNSDKFNTTYGAAMMIDPKTNTPGFVYTSNGTATKRMAYGAYFNGADWSGAVVSGTPSVESSTGAVMSYSPVVMTEDASYVVAGANNKGFQLIKFADKALSAISAYLPGDNYSSQMGLAADSKNNVLLFAADKQGTEDYNLNLSKYDVAKKEWTKMASTVATHYSSTSGCKAAVCVDKDDNIYAAYGDSNSVLYFGGIDPETKDWSGFTALEPTETIKSEILMQFSKDGSVGYLAWLRAKKDTEPNTLVVYECKLEEDILPE